MDERRAVSPMSGHPLQGPHHNLLSQTPPAFVPLRLVLRPSGMRFEISKQEVVVGRHTDADVRLAAPEISRRHCRIFFEQGVWKIQDLSSLNGVHVNEARMLESPLYHGDQVRLGEFQFQIEYMDKQAEVIRQIVEVLPRKAS